MKVGDQTVFITGAAGTLGQACAHRFAEQGARLALLDLSLDSLGNTFSEWRGNPNYLMLSADLNSASEVMKAADKALNHFGAVQILVNIAGGFAMGEAVHETSGATWERMFGLNAKSLIHTSAALVPQMISAGTGKIVNVAARAALEGMPNMGAYCAAKSAVIRLTESQSAELREHNINVNCVLPGVIDTPANRSAMPDEDFARWVEPEALSDVILFLAAPAARAVHGAAVPVYGMS